MAPATLDPVADVRRASEHSPGPDGAGRWLPIDHGGPVDLPFEPFPAEALAGSILDRFGHMVRRHGGRLAVQDAEVALTYADLSDRAARISSALQSAVSGRPGPIALLLANDAHLPAAMLGALGAGRPFVPLDVTHPIDRNRLIAAQAGASAILVSGEADGGMRGSFGQEVTVVGLQAALAQPPDRLPIPSASGDLAYILYTSGSTGAPKGVSYSHRNCLNDAFTIVNNVHLTPEDRLSLFYSSVVAAVRRTFSALLSGASLHIIPTADRGPKELAAEFRARGITYMHEVPTLFRRIAGALGPGEKLDSLRVLRLSGDRSHWADYDLFRKVCGPDAFMGVNLGCTEAPTTYAHWFVDETVRTPGARLPVGRDMDGVAISVVGADGEPLPDGEVGEFRLSSRYLSQGYWQAPELTAERFRPDPDDPAARLYLTGDMGLRRPDGLLEFVGRKDQMIKLRGHRIEPGELESALAACPGVAEAASVIRRDADGVPRAMVAYVELKRGFATLRSHQLMAMISRVLPEHLRPSVIVISAALPRLVNYKLDRQALATLDAESARSDNSRATDPILERVAGCFERVVPGSRATPEDNLLSLGGDSLQAEELALTLAQEFGVEIPRRVLRRSRSIAELSRWISRRLQERTLDRSPGGKSVPGPPGEVPAPLPAGTLLRLLTTAFETQQPPDFSLGESKDWMRAVERLLASGRAAAARFALVCLCDRRPDIRAAQSVLTLLDAAPALAPAARAFVDDVANDVQLVRAPDADRLVVVFCDRRHGLSMPLWLFHHWLAPHRVSVAYLRDFDDRHFVGGVRSQGSRERTAVAIGWLARYAKSTSILCLGHSSGGFAALSYGAAVGAERVLAFSPAVNLEPEFNLTLNRTGTAREIRRAFPGEELDLRAIYRASPQPPQAALIYGDQAWNDRIHAEVMAGLPGVVLAPIEGFAGHGSLAELICRGEMPDLLRRFISPSPSGHWWSSP